MGNVMQVRQIYFCIASLLLFKAKEQPGCFVRKLFFPPKRLSVCMCVYFCYTLSHIYIYIYIYIYNALQKYRNSKDKSALLAVESRHLQI